MFVRKGLGNVAPFLFISLLMFESLKRIANNVKKLDSDKLLKKVFDNKGVQQQIIDLNQEQLRDRHVLPSGKEITRQYSEVSQRIYGKPSGPIILYDTGAFYNSIKVKSEKETIIVKGDTIKDTDNGQIDIGGYVGGNPIGLDETSLSEVRQFILPMVREEVLQAIFK